MPEITHIRTLPDDVEKFISYEDVCEVCKLFGDHIEPSNVFNDVLCSLSIEELKAISKPSDGLVEYLKIQIEPDGPDIDFAKKIGMDIDQRIAMYGMGTMIPRSAMLRLGNKEPDDIKDKIKDELAKAIRATISGFGASLCSTDIKNKIFIDRIKLMRNNLRKDEKIAEETNDPELISFANKEREALKPLLEKLENIERSIKAGEELPKLKTDPQTKKYIAEYLAAVERR